MFRKDKFIKYNIRIFHRFLLFIIAFYIYKFLNSLNYSFHKISLSENTIIISLGSRWKLAWVFFTPLLISWFIRQIVSFKWNFIT